MVCELVPYNHSCYLLLSWYLQLANVPIFPVKNCKTLVENTSQKYFVFRLEVFYSEVIYEKINSHNVNGNMNEPLEKILEREALFQVSSTNQK